MNEGMPYIQIKMTFVTKIGPDKLKKPRFTV